MILQGPSVRPRARTQLRLNVRFNSSSFCSACSRVQGQVAKNWLRGGTPSTEPGKPDPAGMLELDRRLKGRIRARAYATRAHTHAARFNKGTLCKFLTRRERYTVTLPSCSYFGQNIANRSTFVLCLQRSHVIKYLVPSTSALLYVRARNVRIKRSNGRDVCRQRDFPINANSSEHVIASLSLSLFLSLELDNDVVTNDRAADCEDYVTSRRE